MNKSYKKLINNSLLFTVGNIGSKLMTFIMLPLYTYKLSTSEFGTTDLVQTTITLLLPIVYLSIFDAVLRYGLESALDNTIVISNGFFITICASLFNILLLFLLIMMNVSYASYIIIILILQGFQSLFSQYAKAIDKIKTFAFNGILLSFLTAIFNIVFLVYMNYGIDGFFLSIILSNLVSNIFLFFNTNLKKRIDLKKVKKSEMIKLLKYSVPLIPNSIAWWLTTAVSRYFILFFLGVTANGLFAVANKIPAFLTIINSIFYQSWQLSAIEEYENKENKEFFSKVYGVYSTFIFLSCSFILVFVKPIIRILINENFFDSWKYVPFLLLTIVYSSLAGFLGQTYIAAKQTNQLFSTTIIGSLINLIMCVMLLPTIGLQGAGLASSISFFSVWIYRHFNSRKYVYFKIKNSTLILNNIMLLIQIILLVYFNDTYYFLVQALCFSFILIINYKFFESFKVILTKNV